MSEPHQKNVQMKKLQHKRLIKNYDYVEIEINGQKKQGIVQKVYLSQGHIQYEVHTLSYFNEKFCLQESSLKHINWSQLKKQDRQHFRILQRKIKQKHLKEADERRKNQKQQDFPKNQQSASEQIKQKETIQAELGPEMIIRVKIQQQANTQAKEFSRKLRSMKIVEAQSQNIKQNEYQLSQKQIEKQANLQYEGNKKTQKTIKTNNLSTKK